MARNSKPILPKSSAAKSSASNAKFKSQHAKTLAAKKMQKANIIDHEPLEKLAPKKPPHSDTPRAEPVGFNVENFAVKKTQTSAETAMNMPENNATSSSSSSISSSVQSNNPAMPTPPRPAQKNANNSQKSGTSANPAGKSTSYIKRSFCLLIAGMMGGIIALCLAAILQYFSLLPQFRNSASLNAEIVKNSNEIAALTKKLNALEKTSLASDNNEDTASTSSLPINTIINDLQNNIANLNEKIALLDKDSNDNVQNITIAQNAIAEQITALQQAIGQLPNLSQNLEKLTAENNALTGKTDANSQAISVMLARIDDVQKQLQQPIAGKGIAIITAANALKNAVDRGGSYKNELELLQNIAPNIGHFDMLQKTANIGLPNTATLAQEFTTLADQIAATENLAPDEAGFTDRIFAKAKSIVTTRPIGNVEGSNPAAIAARMEVAIAKGDYQTAISEWQNLPENAKKISANFIETLKAKNDIDALLANIIALSLKANNNDSSTE